MKNIIVSILVFICLAAVAEAAYLEKDCGYDRAGSFITAVYAGDLDGDGVNEIFAGSDNGQIMDFSYKDIRCTYKWDPKWSHLQSTAKRGNIIDMRIANVDADAKNEFVVAADSINDYIMVLNNDGGFFEWSDENSGGRALSLDIADVDSDGKDEIVYGNEGNTVVALAGKNVAKWKSTLDNPVYFVKAVDVNDDGKMEVVALSNKYADVANVYVLDGANGKRLWSYEIDSGVYQASKNTIDVDDIDDDGKKEIIVATYKEGVIALDDDGKLLWNYGRDNTVTSVYFSDLDGDGVVDVLAASNPYLYMFTPDGKVKLKLDIGGGAMIIQSADLEGDGFEEIVTATKGGVQVYKANGAKKGEWATGKDVSTISMYVMDLDDDGEKEILVGFGWAEGRLDSIVKGGQMVLLKVTGAADVEETTTTEAGVEETTSSTTKATAQKTTTTFVKPQQTTTTQAAASGGFDFGLIAIIAVIGGGLLLLLVLAVVVFFFLKKKKKDAAPAEEKKEEEATEAPAAKEEKKKKKEE
jgi:hypothetical protein